MASRGSHIDRLLNYWIPPAGAGDPIGLIATSFTFDSEFFEEECLSNFLQMDTDPQEDGPIYLIEREEKLAQIESISVIVDQAHCRGKRSLRWDLIGFRSLHLLHAKISLLVWSNHIRIIMASGNLTANGYRYNREIFGVFNFNKKDSLPVIGINIFLAPTLFFLFSNFIVWLTAGGIIYTYTTSGLLYCYEMGLPFYKQHLISTMIFAPILFAPTMIAKSLKSNYLFSK